MDDYYSRGFGKAAATVGEYWDLLEEANSRLVRHPDYTPFGLGSPALVEVIQDVYTKDIIDRAHELLEQAALEVKDEPAKYGERVAFLGTGLEFTDLMMQAIHAMSLVRESGGKDRGAVEKAIELWEKIDKLLLENPMAIKLSPDPQNRWRVKVNDYLGPPSEEYQRAAGLIH
jgi:hypothetical protein